MKPFQLQVIHSNKTDMKLEQLGPQHRTNVVFYCTVIPDTDNKQWNLRGLVEHVRWLSCGLVQLYYRSLMPLVCFLLQADVERVGYDHSAAKKTPDHVRKLLFNGENYWRRIEEEFDDFLRAQPKIVEESTVTTYKKHAKHAVEKACGKYHVVTGMESMLLGTLTFFSKL